MAKDHLHLQAQAGTSWGDTSSMLNVLDTLPLENAEENFRETDTRYLLPRKNIFMFGLHNGISDQIVYFSCKMCRSFVKPHDLRKHMVAEHLNQDSNIVILPPPPPPPTPVPQKPAAKSKKTPHKSKKKVTRPRAVPPPPLFPRSEMLPPAPVLTIDDLLPPVLLPTEKSQAKPLTRVPSAKTCIATLTTTSTSSSVAVTTATTTTTSVTKSRTSAKAASVSSLPAKAPTQVVTRQPPATRTASKSKTASKKSEKETSKRRHSKRKKTTEYNPDKHCGVLDSSRRHCVRALTCANHTIIERRRVHGRSKSVDKLILEYKAAKLKSKTQPILPIIIAPKQCSTVKEVRNGFRVIEVIYENENQDPLGQLDVQDSEDCILTTVLEDLTTVSQVAAATSSTEDSQVVTNTKPTTRSNLAAATSPKEDSQAVNSTKSATVSQRAAATSPKEDSQAVKSSKPITRSHHAAVTLAKEDSQAVKKTRRPTLELEQAVRSTKLPSGSFLTVSLSSKAGEVPSLTPTFYNSHPKPMTMQTAPLRRIGSSLLMHPAPRLERQRADLQAVANQHKQLNATPTKQVSLLTSSSSNKQSLLKSNVKGNTKINSLKRPMLEKGSTENIKQIKIITSDLNGFLVNTEFPDNDVQPSGTAHDKISLLK